MSQVLPIMGILNLFLAGAMIVPMVISWHHGEKEATSFLISIGITALVGLALYLPFPKKKGDITRRQAFTIVSFGWMCASIFGALPFALTNTFAHPLDALFEAVSGLTTTGASVLTSIDGFPKGLHFWRALIQWLGGMGIILFSIAVLPFLGVGGMQMYQAEVPGPFKEKLRPRIAETAKILWQTYLLISGLEAALLFLGGMSIFDSLCHTFTTMATGGFSTKGASIGFYGSYHRIVITFFMFLAGTNFALHYRFLKGDHTVFWRDREFRFYLLVILMGVGVVFWNLISQMGGNWGDRLEEASFQVVSIMTTTGYATTDFGRWPPFCQHLLLLLMFVGGCAGSTGGAIKCIRVLLLFKYVQQELRRIIHPHAVVAVKIGEKTISPSVLNGILGMVILYMVIFVFSSITMSLLGLDMITSTSSVAATLGNIGPGLGKVGPAGHYAHLPSLGKGILIFCMLVGRLEVYTVIILLFPEFWRK
ncbi:MAG: TrkH family potassium uptake protein [Deltaproteobacteria bacterium]|nr:TrkH family potassium uptake protein [Deltaproteobacteria bacterium]